MDSDRLTEDFKNKERSETHPLHKMIAWFETALVDSHLDVSPHLNF